MRGTSKKICIVLPTLIFFIMPLLAREAPAKPKGKLVIGVTTLGNETLDHVKGHGRNEEAIFHTLGDSLVRAEWNGAARIYKPAIATSWKASPDLKTWEFTIRKDVTFHDGTPVTIEDVVYSWERVLTSPISTAASSKRLIESVKAVGDDRAVFHLKDSNAFFLAFIARQPMQPKAYTEKIGEKEFGMKPVYAGSWKLVKHLQGDYVEMEAVENHYRKVPHFKSLTLRIIPEPSTQLAVLKTGEANILHLLQPGPVINEIKQDPKLTLISIPAAGELYGYIANLTKPGRPESPYHDKRVRHAISHAIDRQLIVDKIFYGEGTPSSTTCIIPGTPQWHPSGTVFPYDEEKARALLKEAGYPNGFQTKIITTTREKAAAEAIATMWSKVGIKAELVMMETGAMLTAVRKKTLPDSVRISMHTSNPMGMSYYFQKEMLYTLMNDEKLDQMTKKMMSIPEGPEQDEFIRNNMCRYVHDLVPSLPLVNLRTMSGVGPGLDIDAWVKMGMRQGNHSPAAEYLKPAR